MAWQPVLDGTMAETAREIVLEIAHAVARGDGNPAAPTDRALFWAYLAGAFDEAWIAAEYDRAVSELVENASQWFGLISLYGGVARLGFALSHISEPGEVDASLDTIDAVIAERLETWDGEFDLIRGLAGVGVYLFERGEVARPLIDKIVERLLALSELGPHGRTWLVRPELVSKLHREASPDGHYDCGVAHGVPGVLVVLARAAQLGNLRARIAAGETLQWLDAQWIADAPGFRYPAWIKRDLVTEPARHAWCYGDLGVAVATFGVARRLGSSTAPALQLARDTIATPFERSKVVDAALCHGAAGLAHLYNRLFQVTGEAELRDAARTWFAHVFRLRGQRPEGVAGFAEYLRWPGDPRVWHPTTAILTGVMGIALSLLAAIRADEPNWDRMLMCDL